MRKIKTFKELEEAWEANETIVWNDPDPIEGNDYEVSFIEDLTDLIEEEFSGILIQYNAGGSEAMVFLHELFIID